MTYSLGALTMICFLGIMEMMKLYGGEGDDVLQGGPGADYFDCGDGIDIVIDSNVSEGDDSAGNCEELLNNIVLPSETGQLEITG